MNYDPAIDDGILTGCNAGIITSASAVVNTGLYPSSQRLAQQFPGISIGLHTNLSCHSPVAKSRHVRSLTNANGMFSGFPREQLATVTSTFKPFEVRVELESQIEMFTKYFGRMPSHIDSHHYVHALEPVRSVLLEYAARHRIPVRRPEFPGGVRDSTDFATRVLMTDILILSFRRQNTKLHHLHAIITSLTPGWAELPCHLRFERFPKSAYARQRMQELETLCADSIRRLLVQHGVSLVSYVTLLARNSAGRLCQ